MRISLIIINLHLIATTADARGLTLTEVGHNSYHQHADTINNITYYADESKSKSECERYSSWPLVIVAAIGVSAIVLFVSLKYVPNGVALWCDLTELFIP